jgi:hypothetical protein
VLARRLVSEDHGILWSVVLGGGDGVTLVLVRLTRLAHDLAVPGETVPPPAVLGDIRDRSYQSSRLFLKSDRALACSFDTLGSLTPNSAARSLTVRSSK